MFFMFSDFNNGCVLFCLYCSSCLSCILPDQGHQAPQFQLPGYKGYPSKWLSSDAGQSVAQIFSTGNSAIDGGIIGLGLGALGAAVLGPTLNQVDSRPIICLFVKPNLPIICLPIICQAQSSTGSVCTPDRLWKEEETGGWGGEVTNSFVKFGLICLNKRRDTIWGDIQGVFFSLVPPLKVPITKSWSRLG